MTNAPTLQSTPSTYIVVERVAKMPSSCGYAYEYCAVIETDGRRSVSMISERARGVRRIVRAWAPYPKAGSTSRSAKCQALAAARELAARLNRRTMDERLDAAREAHRTEGC